MAKISLNSVPMSTFRVSQEEVEGKDAQRAYLVGRGRVLYYAHARKGKNLLNQAMHRAEGEAGPQVNAVRYSELNEEFRQKHLLYAAKRVCEFTGSIPPADFDGFRKMAQNFYGNAHFYAVLQGLYTEIITPILPAVYSEAVSAFAEVVEVGFGETYSLAVGSNDIPIFQDSSWGASRSVPRNRFYDATYTLNPTPKSAWVTAKWTQLVGNGMDFGRFFANIAAGLYAKTMGMWSQALTTAAANTGLIPAALNYTFNNPNWVAAANKVAALNHTTVSNLIAVGGMVPLSKVLPTNATGSTNVNMDAAIATLLGADYTRSGYLGEFMAVRLMPLMDAVVPGTQNTTVKTVLSQNDIWMMAGAGYKPLTIAYNSGTPITIEMDPTKTADFEIGINITTALDMVAVFASKVAHFTI